jgi:Mn2+/Fe2+ NRAMP family transporter
MPLRKPGVAPGPGEAIETRARVYVLILLSTGVGVGLDFVDINSVKALYWTAVLNGLLAPFLLVAILVVASDRKLMQGQPSSRLGWTVVAITTVAMFAAGVAMFVV